MGADVIAFPARETDDESWLTKRRMAAYYVLGIIRPELMASGPDFALPRTAEVERIEAALHAAEQIDEAENARARDYVIGVMRMDNEAAERRRLLGGW